LIIKRNIAEPHILFRQNLPFCGISVIVAFDSGTMSDRYRHQTLCILGGGQLGKMLIQKAWQLDMNVIALDHDPLGPCRILGDKLHIGSFADEATVLSVGALADLITVEIEHVSVEALVKLRDQGKIVHPAPELLALVQDKGAQKLFYQEHGYPSAKFQLIETNSQIQEWKGNFPLIQKTRRGGYDGKGVMKIERKGDWALGFDTPSVLEECLEIEQELSVLVARDEKGNIAVYPPVEMIFNDTAHLVELLICPPSGKPIPPDVTALACDLACDLGIVGILAVEVFIDHEGFIYINEIAPRPHNSGHMTIEANATSQYEQHLRAVYGLPLGGTELIAPAVMINLLGTEAGQVQYEGLEYVFQTSNAHLHLYGKTQTKPFRKMGHITVLDRTIEEAMRKALLLKEKVRVGVIRGEW